ncbi:MAG: RagB/SusD family nutrient uptake outer membrane protein [Dysgonamonadaceae bacterium]|jgi:hypothetical protein|nr:RagB/SusD family nutrient uptake outer membrane protein [Dysgonamonadaceae bacterium]
MKKIIKSIKISVLVCCGFFAGCADWLDIVPDGVATLDNAFSNRINAERFLFGCYNMIPNQNDPFNYPGNVGSDDILWNMTLPQNTRNGSRIARGEQNATDPIQDYWDGRNGGRELWVGIRDCNIFLENIHRVPDLPEWERLRWISEVKFIKAYLHFFLLKMYGPIPIVDVNLSINAPPEEVRVFRDPVDEVVEFIVNLLDESMAYLPPMIYDTFTEQGRVTELIARSVKAKVLVWAASPLFNGNPDYANFTDRRGRHLFSTTYDNTKWEKALKAVDEAIEMAYENGHQLFDFTPGAILMSETTRLKYTLRGAVSERPVNFNQEVIWAHPARNETNNFQNFVTPKWASFNNPGGIGEVGTTLKMAELYYTTRGIPIDEDIFWNYAERFEVRRDTGNFHQYYIRSGEITAHLNFYREPRFYAFLGFDRGLFESLTAPGADGSVMIEARSGQVHGVINNNNHIMSGYFIKKLVSPRSSVTANSPQTWRFTIPNIRLADLYLLRAEAANEVQDTPNNEVWYWIDIIRERAGLEGVVDSWARYSNMPGKPLSKEGMREIIKRERNIELSFEGQRFFDLRRWKDAMKYLNQPMQGWDYQATSQEEYYRVRTYFNSRNFSTRDYLWPIRSHAIIRNINLEQNPGW